MKTLLKWAVLCLSLLSLPTLAQDCAGFNMKEGSGFEMNNFNAKGKPTGKLNYKISKVAREGGNMILTVDMEMFDEKDKSILKNNYTLTCNGNVLTMDARSLISEEQLRSFKDMEMKYTYENIEYPMKYSVGETLKDASVKGNGQSGPMPIAFNLQIKNRKVESQEKLTVPAGTFDAYKINSDMNMEMKMGFPIKMDMQSISYRTPGVIWDLKTETYRKGKLMGYSELNKIY
ncbi:TapB family protein [Dyadobacter luticola]|uniref:DUF3108 domain-containing protein n=1 Tax=Dyadobacter luticola TaxID=1979387 RepID=A0A5R9KSZ8_9BACT|nr:hypothetical protein [Dyadobacter luticola]TLU99425.1 hypothetical protein FEN17_22980 [Dyadobacter luticola]